MCRAGSRALAPFAVTSAGNPQRASLADISPARSCYLRLELPFHFLAHVLRQFPHGACELSARNGNLGVDNLRRIGFPFFKPNLAIAQWQCALDT